MNKKTKKAIQKAVNAELAEVASGAEWAVKHITIMEQWGEMHSFAHQNNEGFDCNETGNALLNGIKQQCLSLTPVQLLGYGAAMKAHRIEGMIADVLKGDDHENPFKGMTIIPVETDGTESREDLLARAKQAMKDTMDLNLMNDNDTIEDPKDPDEQPGVSGNTNGEDDQ